MYSLKSHFNSTLKANNSQRCQVVPYWVYNEFPCAGCCCRLVADYVMNLVLIECNAIIVTLDNMQVLRLLQLCRNEHFLHFLFILIPTVPHDAIFRFIKEQMNFVWSKPTDAPHDTTKGSLPERCVI